MPAAPTNAAPATAPKPSTLSRRRLRTGIGLAAIAIAALVWVVVEGRALGAIAGALQTQRAPRRFVSLALAGQTTESAAILREWHEGGLIETARRALEADGRFIAAYVTFGVALALFAAWLIAVPQSCGAVVVLMILVAGGCDLLENHFLARQLDHALKPNCADITAARAWAMTKFVALLLAGWPLVAFLGGGLRQSLVRRAVAVSTLQKDAADDDAPPDLEQFRALITSENACIFPTPSRRPADNPAFADNPNADEPRISFRAADVIGLALSGGGIRSATFNLGLLQGLNRRDLLPLFDYLSTVSGGGYIGAFWSAWLRLREAQPERKLSLFPTTDANSIGLSEGVDTHQVRHLREFAGFLAPRWGFFEVETWRALVAVVAGLIPALLMGLCLIGVALVCWLSLTFPLAYRSAGAGIAINGLITLTALVLFELMWQNVKMESSGGRQKRGLLPYVVVALFALAIVGAAQWLVPWAHEAGNLPALWHPKGGSVRGLQASFTAWWSIVGLNDEARRTWVVSPHLFDFAAVWFAVSLVLVVVRLAFPLSPRPWPPECLSAFDRVLMRVLGLGVSWCLIAGIWHGVLNVGTASKWIAVAAVASGGLFASLRNWIGVALRRPKTSGPLARVKPYIPQVLAYMTIVLATVAVGKLLVEVAGTSWTKWFVATASMSAALGIALFLNPAEFGLHAFYRDRLSRAFSGAVNIGWAQRASDNRATEPRSGDDVLLASLVKRPLHLVCCAANDLSGDTIETLGRGSRSAVLSRNGFSVGRYAAASDLMLGSAITASAAAFNSNMGSVSMELGPAVAFLMTALNLRLGVWARHPAAAAERPRRWPGVLLYREMFGLTSASGEISKVSGTYSVPRLLRDVHLSDGAHFENLALYELIRRHCRYILLSDCGADPHVSFDDLGNALRRIREDFGVDISIDVQPLRPGPTGLAKQHVAIGTIHYSPTDRGILLYLKPSLTGDEPPDVLQYQTRNTAFPHESTGDQFYDEAQYESYRRLGLHAADAVFAFVPPAADPASGHVETPTGTPRVKRDVTADWVFVEATHVWGPTPPGLAEAVVAMTGRLTDFEAELQRHLDEGIVQEVFAEMGFVAATVDPQRHPRPAGSVTASTEILLLVTRMTQLMEDVWIACQLDEWWAHPLNLGWVNVFARWASAPSYRFWWPVISPMYSPGFRRFIEQRFPIPGPPDDVTPGVSSVRIPQRGAVSELAADAPDGLAAVWWKERSTQPRNWNGRKLYQNLVDLPLSATAGIPMQVGIVAVTKRGGDVGWASHDFFVPPSLWGAGIGWYFLDNLLNELHEAPNAKTRTVYVIVKAVPQDTHHQIALDDRLAFIDQYRKMGFRRENAEPGDFAGFNGELLTELQFKPGDALLTLDLGVWACRRGRSRARSRTEDREPLHGD